MRVRACVRVRVSGMISISSRKTAMNISSQVRFFARTGPLRTARGCFEGEFSAPVSWQVKEVCTAEAETAASAEKEAVVITLRMFSLHSLSQI